jgi:hypothetical protein
MQFEILGTKTYAIGSDIQEDYNWGMCYTACHKYVPIKGMAA